MARKGYRQCSKCGTNRQERFYVSARGRVCSTCRKRRTRGASREQRLLDTYGISLDDYDKLFKAQGGRCAICDGKRPGNLDVDHDHAVEKELLKRGFPKEVAARLSVRGLLCRRCNRRLLPASLDSPVVLASAIDYLHLFPALRVLHSRKDSAQSAVEQWRAKCVEYHAKRVYEPEENQMPNPWLEAIAAAHAVNGAL